MTTLVVTVDDAAASKARQVAQRRQTSLENMLSGFVVSLSKDDSDPEVTGEREAAAENLSGTFQALSRPLGGKGYVTRDELYER